MDEQIMIILNNESRKIEQLFCNKEIKKMDLTISILGEGLPSMKEENAEN